jgi:hypothetical protein
MKNKVIVEYLIVSQLVKQFPREVSLLCSEEPAVAPCPEPIESLYTPLFLVSFITALILSYKLCIGFPTVVLRVYPLSSFSMCMTILPMSPVIWSPHFLTSLQLICAHTGDVWESGRSSVKAWTRIRKVCVDTEKQTTEITMRKRSSLTLCNRWRRENI